MEDGGITRGVGLQKGTEGLNIDQSRNMAK
jgi:hypothetical protein